MTWWMVMLCGAVGGVFLGFVAGALLGLWIVGDPPPPTAPEGKPEERKGEAAGNTGPDPAVKAIVEGYHRCGNCGHYDQGACEVWSGEWSPAAAWCHHWRPRK